MGQHQHDEQPRSRLLPSRILPRPRRLPIGRDNELNQKTARYMSMRISRALADVSTMLQGIHGIDLTK